MPQHDIGIVIVSYNVRSFLEQCLVSVRNAVTSNLSVEIWVVDNASVDGTAQMVRELFPEVRYIQNHQNVGFSTANNQAIRQMDAKYVLLLNPDTVIEEKTLQYCYDFMECHPKAGAVGIRMIDGSGKFLPESKRGVPDLWNSFCKLFYLSGLFPTSKLFSGYYLGFLPEMETNKVEVLCGAFMFIRSDTLEKTGLLDEAFFMYGEDIDLSYRILKNGYDVWYYPDTTIIHYKGESTKKASLQYLKTFYGAMQIYVSKHYGHGKASVFAYIINAVIGLRAIMSGIVMFLSSTLMLFMDGLIFFGCLWIIKSFWAVYYFEDADYYSNSPITLTLLGYTLIWISALWLNGYYDHPTSLRKRWTSILTGTVIILLIYALLPEMIRTSRAIILLGAFAGILALSVSSFMYKLFFNRKITSVKDNNIAIVGTEYNILKLIDVYKTSYRIDACYHISPYNDAGNSFFTNSLMNLPVVVQKLMVNEVVFCSEDVAMKDIFHTMSSIGSGVSYKIGSVESMSIIGSDDRNTRGELIYLSVQYRLEDITIRRYKRLSDILLSIIFIIFSPILWLLNGMKGELFLHIFNVLTGKYTWIGYAGIEKDYYSLPVLPKSIIPCNISNVYNSNADLRSVNISYAKRYSLWTDIGIVLYNLNHLV